MKKTKLPSKKILIAKKFAVWHAAAPQPPQIIDGYSFVISPAGVVIESALGRISIQGAVQIMELLPPKKYENRA